jgi:hypothetical protein
MLSHKRIPEERTWLHKPDDLFERDSSELGVDSIESEQNLGCGMDRDNQ